MKLVLGATGGAGGPTVRRALDAGHELALANRFCEMTGVERFKSADAFFEHF